MKKIYQETFIIYDIINKYLSLFSNILLDIIYLALNINN